MDDVLFCERDPFAPIKYSYTVNKVLYEKKSHFQEIMVLENSYFGKILVLDGVVQLTEKDEFFYHEMLAHVPLHAHPSPATVLIIGGGDGGTLREVLKHQMVQEIILVEIDPQVIEVARQFFPKLSRGFTDPRTKLLEMDGKEFLRETRKKFDLILVDSTDPVNFAASLYSEEVFLQVLSVLKDDGIFVAQTESLHFHRQFVIDTQQKLSKIFPLVYLYTVTIPTYAGNWWSFSLASRKYDCKKSLKKCRVDARYYNEDIHRHAFLPDSLYDKIINGRADW